MVGLLILVEGSEEPAGGLEISFVPEDVLADDGPLLLARTLTLQKLIEVVLIYGFEIDVERGSLLLTALLLPDVELPCLARVLYLVEPALLLHSPIIYPQIILILNIKIREL